jgi:nitroreductase/Pyruvate/2-oxoacid:ferredoxin oxidoreductase delta subunit
MNLVNVDAELCNFCGVCLDDCAFQLLEMKTPRSLPTPREIAVRTAHQRCINCGHCVIVCPTAALSITPQPHAPEAPACQDPSKMLPMRDDLRVSAAQVDQLLKGRRTCRTYRTRAVPRAVLEEIIEVASYAPSGHNNQQVNWVVVSDRDQIRRIGQAVIDFLKANREPRADLLYPWNHHEADADVIVDLWERGEDSVFRGAPHLIMVTGDPSYGILFTGREQHALRLAYLELAAHPRGIRTVWNGFFTAAHQMAPEINDVLDLPDGQVMFDSMSLGYPKGLHRVRRIPLRNEPRIEWR